MACAAPTFLHQSIEPPGAICSAQLLQQGDPRLLLLLDTHLTECLVNGDGLEQGASWQSRCSILQMVVLPQDQLLLLGEGGQCSLHRLQPDGAAPTELAHTVLPSPAEAEGLLLQAYGCVISSNLLSAEIAPQASASLLAVSYAAGVLHLVKAAPRAGGMSLEAKAMPYRHAALSCSFPDLSGAPPLVAVRVHSRVLAMAWLPPAEQQLDLTGRSLLAVLHEFSPSSQPPTLHVDVLAVDWLTGSVSPGPWSLRNVHPTSRLLRPFPGNAVLPAGLLLFSSRSLLLCSCRPQPSGPGLAASSSSAAAAALLPGRIDAVKQSLGLWSLSGLILGCAAADENTFIIGCDSAELFIVRLPDSSAAAGAARCQRLHTKVPLAVPHELVYIPLQQQQQQQQADDMALDTPPADELAGLLFIGSRSSSSQVLGVPRALLQAISSGPGGCQDQQQLECPVLQPALLPSLAACQAATVIRDPTGMLPEQQLVLACGAAPRGKLALVRSGAGLKPLLIDGPELPGDALLFPIVEHPACSHVHHPPQQACQQQPSCHTLLGFSFPAAGVSEVTSLAGSTFRHLDLPGLQQGLASLLLAGLPGGWLLQVTPAGAWVLGREPDRQLHRRWAPPAGQTISLASVAGGCLVVACGDVLHCCTVSCCEGSIQQVAQAELQQQASALALLALSDGQLLVAAGLWVDNSLLLMSWPGKPDAASASGSQQQQQQAQRPSVGCVVELGGAQPRSVALLAAGGTDLMLVGTNTGSVLLWELQQAGPGQWALQHGRAVQVSSASVNLQQMWLPAADDTSGAVVPCVYAQSRAGAILRLSSGLLRCRQLQQQEQQNKQQQQQQGSLGHPLAATDCVFVSRLCGSEDCQVAAAINSPSMPHGLAWASAQHRLCFGAIVPQHKLHWRSRPLEGTPLALAHHAATNTLVLLVQAEAQQGQVQKQQQQLVLMDASSLCVLLVVGLAQGHRYTALEVLELPCTSLEQQQPHGDGTAAQTSAPAAAAAAAAAAAGGGNSEPGKTATAGAAVQPCKPFIVLASYATLDISGTSAADSQEPAGAAAGAAAGCGAALLPPSTPAAAAAGDDGDASSASLVQVGVLSFFELSARLVQQPAAGNAAPGAAGAEQRSQPEGLSYSLVLHGMAPLPFIPASICTVVPQLLQLPAEAPAGGAGAAAGSARSRPQLQAAVKHAAAQAAADARAVAGASCRPLLAIGSDRGVHLWSVLVDDARLGDKQLLQRHLAAAGVVADDPMEDDGSSTPAAAAAAAAAASQQPEPAAHVACQELSCCLVLSGGAVLQLRSAGSSITARESLGSVTVLAAVRVPGAAVQLLPVGADASGLMAMDALPVAAATAGAGNGGSSGGDVGVCAGRSDACSSGTGAPGFAAASSGSSASSSSAAVAALAEQEQHLPVLVATHPAGLMLLQRDLAAEREHLLRARLAAVQAWESGATAAQQAGAALQQQIMAAAVQPWLGEGEAAPWVVHQQQQGNWGLAAAGGSRQADQRPGLLPLGPQAAPLLMPSAACAPDPGTSLLCAARLGLHIQQQQQQEGQAQGSSSSSRSAPASSPGWAAPVWCVSASGALSVAQLLRPDEARALQRLQTQLKLNEQQQQPPGGDELAGLALFGQPGGPLPPLQRLAASTGDGDEELPENCISGDLLLSRLAADGPALLEEAVGSEHAGGVLVQQLLQHWML